MWQNIILVGIGSMFGGISRYLISHFIHQKFNSEFPWATFIVNIAGCFIIGFLSGIFPLENLHFKHRLLLATGFCGSFTTFSTFSMENMSLMDSKAYLLMFTYIATSIILGVAAAWLGLSMGRITIK
ncbi:fluoride efflux transporter CrcB [Porphyromonadaceae bacterium OttesenSCG-928-L07]|nr:fluoride efflux transporter CrcB [Porphyromonadaceae bacterium OttesenSCG-928-L07]MDL2251801.1 fluoride efflux transporter CrcB [Odoribacter sp. OttesenSCG-928-J03]MDL2330854.1 fluoride efflux transporter CrcB [Odoribacter sp. OttesenSCG-928-A06]